jgi:transcriptional regulator NrdR family protein
MSLKDCTCGQRMKVIDSRMSDGMWRRRYRCRGCGRKKSTLEMDADFSAGRNGKKTLMATMVQPYVDIMNDAIKAMNGQQVKQRASFTNCI